MHNKRPWLAMVIAGASLAPMTTTAAGFVATRAAAVPALTPAPSLTAAARLQFVAQAPAGSRAPAPGASSPADRIAGLERTVDGLRGEARANRELADQLRDRLTRAEETGRWTVPLLAGVLFLTALAAWLAWRLNSAQRLRQLAGLGQPSQPQGLEGASNDAPASKPQTSPIPFVASGPPALTESGRPRAGAARAPALTPPGMEETQPLAARSAHELAMARTQVLPPRAEATEGVHREVSIEELIDLDQQAEFFVVLGQDDAAVELLVEHLRLTGGGSPLPYLKLLEIYRRRGVRPEYERMRARFNQRFNAFAPDWDTDMQGGRTLEAYPGVLPRLQQAWARPLDAMAELDALLFRRTRAELFELPAYREALLLYSMARDLMDREVAGASHVDLLLPLAEGAEFGVTAPSPYLGLERDSGFAPLEPEDRTGSPVDLDLSSENARPASIFDALDPLDETAAAAKRR